MKTRVHAGQVLLVAGVSVTLAIGLLTAAQTAYAAGPAPVGLGTAAPFAVLAGTPAVTNTGPTTITGDLGISPAAAVTGFPPGTVNGTIHAADAVALQAKSDLVTAYNDAAGRAPFTTVAGDTLGGITLVAGVYKGGALALTGTLTLDGQNDPSSVWVFQASSSLITASSSSVHLINGASACNVFWQVTSSATLGSGSTFVGTILALTSITLNSGVTLNGRALARNGEVTLISDTITSSTCSAAPSPTASPSASPTASPSASPTASPMATLSPSPTPVLTAKASLPPTATLGTAGGHGPGLTPVVVVGIFLLALVAVVSRRSLRATQRR
ncbi:MAG: ice-binding family protein [Candidatus Limnocylindrales bacterium]